ncbi:hypothetical protein GBA52_001094 [Prunus armeniaca]|nr:hypothetical protein GBA52_001094 [Prunus armeniaca]
MLSDDHADLCFGTQTIPSVEMKWHMATVPGLTLRIWKDKCSGFHSDVSRWQMVTALTFSPSSPFRERT